MTLLHPLFFTNNATRGLEIEEDAHGKRVATHSIKVKEYLKVAPRKAGLYLPNASMDDSQVRLCIVSNMVAALGTDRRGRRCFTDHCTSCSRHSSR